MGSYLSFYSSEPETHDTATAAEERDRAYVERVEREDPERFAKVRDATRRHLGLVEDQSINQSIDDQPILRSAPGPLSTPATKLSDYDFPFENLVFEGGGGKGRIYGGALKCLRDAGIKTRRFAGSSAGAITAALMAVNVPLEEIDKIMSQDLKALLMGKAPWWISYGIRVPIFFSKLGFYNANKFVDFFGQVLKKNTGNPDITFAGVFEQFGTELCITAVNVNLMSISYFHPKTTPFTPVRTAVRMSMSIPGLFTPVQYSSLPGCEDKYVDGGVLCNYPIHVFDGWWFSMDREDNYYLKLRPFDQLQSRLHHSDRFGKFNAKTLGFVVYSHDENQDMRHTLDERIKGLKIERPVTPLRRKREAERKKKELSITAGTLRMDVTNRFVDTLLKLIESNNNPDDISRDQFTSIFSNLKPKADSMADELTTEDAKELFGTKYDPDALFDRAGTKKQGEVRVAKLFIALEKELDLRTRFLGHERKDAEGLTEYWVTLFNTIQDNAGKMFTKGKDADRTVGLYTDYVGTMDFSIDVKDQKFLDDQGYKTTELFLRDYISKNKLEPRTANA